MLTPFQLKLKRSRLYISIVLPVLLILISNSRYSFELGILIFGVSLGLIGITIGISIRHWFVGAMAGGFWGSVIGGIVLGIVFSFVGSQTFDVWAPAFVIYYVFVGAIWGAISSFIGGIIGGLFSTSKLFPNA